MWLLKNLIHHEFVFVCAHYNKQTNIVRTQENLCNIPTGVTRRGADLEVKQSFPWRQYSFKTQPKDSLGSWENDDYTFAKIIGLAYCRESLAKGHQSRALFCNYVGVVVSLGIENRLCNGIIKSINIQLLFIITTNNLSIYRNYAYETPLHNMHMIHSISKKNLFTLSPNRHERNHHEEY